MDSPKKRFVVMLRYLGYPSKDEIKIDTDDFDQALAGFIKEKDKAWPPPSVGELKRDVYFVQQMKGPMDL
jgi:hypothetical protein